MSLSDPSTFWQVLFYVTYVLGIINTRAYLKDIREDDASIPKAATWTVCLFWALVMIAGVCAAASTAAYRFLLGGKGE